MGKRIIVGVVIILEIFISYSMASNIDVKSVPKRGFWSERPAENWEEALVTGNGIMGAMIEGHPYHDTLILNQALLYLPLYKPLKPVSQGKHLNEIRSLLVEGKYEEASQFVVALSRKEGWGFNKRWTDPFIPAFNITIEISDDSVINYRRTVDFESGVVDVKWEDRNGKYLRDTFVSRSDNVVVTRFISDGVPINCKIGVAERLQKTGWADILGLKSTGISDINVNVKNNYITFRAVFENQWENLIKGYEGVVFLRNRGGSLEGGDSQIWVQGVNELLMLARIEPFYELTTSHLSNIIAELDNMKEGYHKLLMKHVVVHSELFNRCKIHLGDYNPKKMPIEEWLVVEDNKIDLSLVECQFDAARYNIISSIGINPPNLQGIWSGVFTPPWSSDFTMNGNLPVAVSSLLSTNMTELMLPLFNMLERHIDDFEINANELFNCRGIHIPSRMSTHGLNNHFDATWPMTFWTGGAGWYSMFFYDYFMYTGDTLFLRDRALPFMEKALLFYEDFLLEGPNGYYVFNPSYSPENNPANISSQACINATMDVMIAKQLLRNVMEASKLLGLNKEKMSLWQSMFEKMPPYEINEKGELREWIWPNMEENHTHRHASQLYALFDMMDPEFKQRPELMSGAQKVIDEKIKVRRQEGGGVMAFGLVQLAFAAAMLGNAEVCSEILEWLTYNYWRNNMVTTHDPHTIFNLDLSGGYPSVIIKMLVYSEPNIICLFPALPADFAFGAIEGLLLRGNTLVKKLQWKDKDIDLELLPGFNRKVLLKFPKKISKIYCKGGIIFPGESPDTKWLEIKKGSMVKLKVTLDSPCYKTSKK